MKKLVVSLALVGLLSLAEAKSFHVKLYQPSVLGSAELKPGDYTLNLTDQKIVVKNSSQEAEATVKVENGASKYGTTTVRYSNGDGHYRIQEIRLGGTNMKLVVTTPAAGGE